MTAETDRVCRRLGRKCSGWVRNYRVVMNGVRLNRDLCDACFRVAVGLGVSIRTADYSNPKGIVWRHAPGGGVSHAGHARSDGDIGGNTLCGQPTVSLTAVGNRREGGKCRTCSDRAARLPRVAPKAPPPREVRA
jgi:hypothetical protein